LVVRNAIRSRREHAALAAGTAVGVILFGRVDDAAFRRVVLATLFVSGLALAL
jgi:hypothetical protein